MAKTYNSIPRDDFHNAVVKYYEYYNQLPWKKGTRQLNIQVYEIIKVDNYDLHLSAMYDVTGRNVVKFHFTLRKGPGKGTDAFAWFAIVGFNKSARLGLRENEGDIRLFTDPALPPKVRIEVDKIDFYAREIFRLAVSYIKQPG